jgi:hypothetical protein
MKNPSGQTRRRGRGKTTDRSGTGSTISRIGAACRISPYEWSGAEKVRYVPRWSRLRLCVKAAAIPSVSAISVTIAIWLAPVGHADSYFQFQSPTGNLDCADGVLNDKAFALCEIREHTWTAPPRPPACEGGWGDRIGMEQGEAPSLGCHTDTVRGVGLPTLGYGEQSSAGPITCDSETSGITCTDSSTGHFFAISRDSYELQ